MEWLWTAALVPFLLCGLMCLAGVALAAVGLRRNRASRRDCCDGDEDSSKAEHGNSVR